MPPGSGVETLAEAASLVIAERGGHPIDFMRRDFMADDPDERRHLLQSEFDAAVLVAGPTATTTELTFRYADQLEQAGLPCTVAVFAPYEATAVYGARRTATRPAHVAFPLRRGQDERALDELISGLTHSPEADADAHPGPSIEALLAEARSEDEALEALHRAGMTDGLPVLLPTADRVERMCRGTSLPDDTIITSSFRPEGRTVRVRDVAANAVLAGALPSHLPAILAAASIMGAPLVDSMTRSVNSFALAQYVSGPYAAEAGVAGATNALGPGNRANAVLGRALGLMIRNLGGAQVGVNSTPAQGNPAAYSLVFTDNPDRRADGAGDISPFTEMIRSIEPEVGPGASRLTMFAGGFTHLGNFYYGGFDELCAALDQPDLPAGALVLLSDKMAQKLAASGFTRESLEQALHEAVRRPMGELRRSGFYPLRDTMTRRASGEGYGAWPASYLTLPDDATVPVYPPGSVLVGVVGSDAAAVAQVWVMGRVGSASIDDFR